ncbi:hypothetical protein LCGC14_0465770 [marine sediment metagenome]|uniref:Uncharacterized protein n=1 Tax=marine sediment metagenome TaxID=412755 RepID=A0A0F9VMK2_9ZZZZ
MTLKDKERDSYFFSDYIKVIKTKDIAKAVKELKEDLKCYCENAYRCPNCNFILKVDKIFGDFNDNSPQSVLENSEDKEPEDELGKNLSRNLSADSSGSDNQKGCGKWYLKEIEKGLNEPCLCGRHGSCPECQGDVCECGHDKEKHFSDKMGELCGDLKCRCKKFKPVKGDGE